jgi:hypothetical protein
MAKFRIKRMKHFAKILQEHHDNGILFYMRDWLCTYKKGDGQRRPLGTDENWCGTSACALGLAALDPVFNKQGLRHSYSKLGLRCSNSSIMFYHGNGRCVDYGVNAGAVFFGIHWHTAEWLFLPCRYPVPPAVITTQHVLRRVQYLIKHNGLPPLSYRRKYLRCHTPQERA